MQKVKLLHKRRSLEDLMMMKIMKLEILKRVQKERCMSIGKQPRPQRSRRRITNNIYNLYSRIG